VQPLIWLVEGGKGLLEAPSRANNVNSSTDSELYQMRTKTETALATVDRMLEMAEQIPQRAPEPVT